MLLGDYIASRSPPLDDFLREVDGKVAARVPGTAVFMASGAAGMPPILVHHVERSRSLHETVILATVQEVAAPVVPEQSRSQFTALGEGFYRLVISFGYMEDPLLLPALEAATR